MKIWKFGVSVLAVMAMPLSASAGAHIDNFEHGKLNWQTGSMQATGIGFPPEKYLNSLGRARAMAVRAAKIDALRNLLEQAQGVQVSSQTLMKDFAVESDLVRTLKSGVVKDASMVGKPHYMDDGSVEITMAINYRKNLAPKVLAAYGQSSKGKADNSFVAPALLDQSGNDASTGSDREDAHSDVISGLIIDAVSLGLRTALTPRILNEDGEVLYSSEVVSEEKINDLAAYDSSAKDAAKLKRVGSSPMTLKALKVVDRTDVVISNEDAKKLIQRAGIYDVLKNARVVFAL